MADLWNMQREFYVSQAIWGQKVVGVMWLFVERVPGLYLPQKAILEINMYVNVKLG